MLVIDLMHEFELGVWKALFTHLIRILSAAKVGDTLVNELDRRYRMVPTFGGATIRNIPATSIASFACSSSLDSPDMI